MMNVNQVFTLGPIQFPLQIIVIALGLIISTLVIKLKIVKNELHADNWLDLLIIALFIFILIYKFGWIVFDLKKVIQNPQSLIWTTGSTETIAIAGFAVILFLAYKTLKERKLAYDILDFSLLTAIITMLIYNVLLIDYGTATQLFIGISLPEESSYLYHPINWYRALFLLILLIWRLFLWKHKDPNKLMNLYFIFGVGLLAISIFDLPINLILGIAIDQWFYLCVALIGAIGMLKNKSDKETD